MEGRNVSRGIGSGAAQIYGQTQNAINQYAKTLQQQQLQREKEAKVLTDELSKVKLEGIRQADIPEFTTKYNEAKDLFAKRLSAKKGADKIMLDSEFKTKMLELDQIAQDSVALGKGEIEFSKMLLNPNIRDRYMPDAVDKFQKAKTLSRNDPNYIRDLTRLEQQIDLSAIMNDLTKIDDTLLKSSQWSRAEQKGMQGNRSGVIINQQRAVSPQDQKIAYEAEFKLNPKFRVALRQMFPQLADMPNEQLKQVAIPELVKQRQRVEYAKPEFKEDEDNSMTPYQIESLALRRAALAKKDSDAEGNVGNVEINKKLYGKSGRDAQGEKRKGTFEAVNFDYFIKPTDKNYASTQLSNVLNINTGKNEMMDADTNVALVGLGYTKRGGKLIPKALIVNSEKDEYVVNESDLPVAVRNSDEYKAAKRKLDQAYQSGGQPKAPTQSTQSKKYSATQEKLISENLKANPAYTREEIIQALGL